MLEPEKLLGKVWFDEESGLYWSEVLHVCEIEHFQAANVEKLRQMLAESARMKKPLGNVVAGRLSLTLDPDIHLRMLELAELAGINIEEWIATTLAEAVNRSLSLETA